MFIGIILIGIFDLICSIYIYNCPIFFKTNTPQTKVSIYKTVKKIDEKKYLIGLIFKDSNQKPINNLFVSIYNHDSNTAQYNYSILKSNPKGEVNFNLSAGSYDAFISTDNQKPSDREQISFVLNYNFNISQEETNESIIRLNKVIIKLNHFKNTPLFKIEARLKHKMGFRPPQMLTTNTINRKYFVFYASNGIFNFNLDTLEFNSKKNISYALAQKNLDLSTSKYIEFDFKNLKKIKVKMDNTKYGWFKLLSQDTGDFQNMYLDKPVDVYTNQDDLTLEMVYIPSPKCINFYSSFKKITPSKILFACDDTNIRYDFNYIPINYNDIFIIKPPTQIASQINKSSIKQGELLTIVFSLINDDSHQIIKTFTHMLWEQPIQAIITFKNSQNEIVYQPNMFTQEDSFYFQNKVCLPPGKYKLSIEKTLDVWGNNKKISQDIDLTVTPGSSCTIPSVPPKPSFKFNSWQDLSQNKDSLNPYSTGNLITYPHFTKKTDGINTKNMFTINSCSDLFKISPQTKTLMININTDSAFNYDAQTKFSKCLSNFSQNNPQYNYVLKNGFFSDLFPTTKLYVLYFYYLQLHQNPQTFVGILADNFYELFYGFQDFTLIDKNNFIQITNSQNDYDFLNTLNDWLDQYSSITPSPIYLLK